MRQRVMIAMALSCNPRLIIADEPTTALDVTIQAQILELMQDLAAQFGTAMIIITHNLGVVARYAHRVIVMYAGKIIETGNAREIYHNPSHPYTMGLAGIGAASGRSGTYQTGGDRRTASEPGNMPGGCSFAPRCRFAIEKCLDEEPLLADVTDGHNAACWRAHELLEAVRA